jgi:hypothetical protein
LLRPLKNVQKILPHFLNIGVCGDPFKPHITKTIIEVATLSFWWWDSSCVFFVLLDLMLINVRYAMKQKCQKVFCNIARCMVHGWLVLRASKNKKILRVWLFIGRYRMVWYNNQGAPGNLLFLEQSRIYWRGYYCCRRVFVVVVVWIIYSFEWSQLKRIFIHLKRA